MTRLEVLREAALLCGAEAGTYLSREARATSPAEKAVWGTEAEKMYMCFETLMEMAKEEENA